METLNLLMSGIAVALQPGNLLFAGIGVLLGTLVGILPGISPSLTVALLLPVTFKLDPTGSIIMFAGIYFGGMYGSSTTAILLNTPGEAASIATAIEGHRMAKAGRGGPALSTAATAARTYSGSVAAAKPYWIDDAPSPIPWATSMVGTPARSSPAAMSATFCVVNLCDTLDMPSRSVVSTRVTVPLVPVVAVVVIGLLLSRGSAAP